MNVLDFLHKSGIFESKGDARRAIKGNSISVDSIKITDDKKDILIEDVELENIDAGTWLCNVSVINKGWNESFITEDLLMFRLISKFGLKNIKGKNSIIDMILKNIFLVENGKKNFFIVKIKQTDGE